MDRGALIGGAAVIAALGGVVAFYLVLSSGGSVDVEDIERNKPTVETLQDRSSEGTVTRANTPAGTPEKGPKDQMAAAMKLRAHTPDPEAAKNWAAKRAEAATRDQAMVGDQLERFFKDASMPEAQQKDMWTLFNDNFELRNSIREEIEAGTTSPRVGRKRLEQQREQMKEELLNRVSEDQYEQLRQRMNKVKVVLF